MIENKGDARFEQKPQTPKSSDSRHRHPLTLMWALSHYPTMMQNKMYLILLLFRIGA